MVHFEVRRCECFGESGAKFRCEMDQKFKIVCSMKKNYFEMNQKRHHTLIRLKRMPSRFLIHFEAIEFAVFDPLYNL